MSGKFSINPPERADGPGAVDFYFELTSPYSYLAAKRLPALAARAGRRVRWRSIELGKVSAGTGPNR